MKSFNVAIDGPAGAGKSTIARMAASKLGFIYVDTGAMYRAMALLILEKGVDPSRTRELEELCSEAEITIEHRNGEQVVLLNGRDVTSQLRSEQVGNMASVSSTCPAVREKMTQLQRQLAARENVVMDGRDIGTVVLPDAQVKIYLTASAKVRAQRRCLELEARGEHPDAEQILKDIEERDYRDMHREIAPLKQARDAVLLDASDQNIDEVVSHVLQLIEEKR